MIGQIISHCRILEKLGEGGMGVVYKAHDLTLDRIVALKFLPPRSFAQDTEQIRFQQEAKAAANLNHPNVCTIYRFDEHDGQQFIEMEYVDGESLKKTTPIQNVDKALGHAIQIGEALQEAHSKGVVHRDVKTENIMLNSKHQIKVMDFGLAKLKGSMKLTKPSSTVGTIAYMAPEQIQGLEVDGRSDIFSFGVVLFEMFTGVLPFRGDHEAAMMYSILNEEPESVQNSRPDLPAELDRIIRRAVEKDPEDRYQHVDDMVSELRKMKKQSTRVSRISPGSRPTQSSALKTGETDADVPGPGRNNPLNARTRRFVVGGVVAVVLLAAFIGYTTLFDTHQSINSLAVLPFTNIGASVNTEYLSDGMTESLINRLSQISNLTVMSRSAVFHYKGNEIDPQKAGIELGVRAVLAGRVVQRDDKLQVSVELVDVSNNSHVWGEQYNKNISDLQAVQEDISREISRSLSLKLAGEDEKKLVRRSTDDPEAYRLYLKGRYNWNKRLPKDLRESIRNYQEALVKDPGYADAYAGLSDSYLILGDYNLSPPRETYPKAKEAAQKALEVDPENASAHTSLAYSLMRSDRDWPAAGKEFQLAIQLDSNSAQAHSWYALYLSLTGRYEDAMTEVKKALALDPFSAVIRTDAGMVFYFSRKYDLTVEQVGKALEIDPAFIVAKMPLGGAYVQLKMYQKAIEAFEMLNMASVIGTSAANPVPIAALAYVYGVSGRKEDALTYIELLQERSEEHVYVAPYWMAVAHAGSGNITEVFRWLQKANEEGDGNLIFLGVDPIFDQLHADQRFQVLMKDLGLGK